jgi:hypothetical protein
MKWVIQWHDARGNALAGQEESLEPEQLSRTYAALMAELQEAAGMAGSQGLCIGVAGQAGGTAGCLGQTNLARKLGT